MDLMDFVLEARKSPTRLNIKADPPDEDKQADFSAGVPEDPDENAEDNANEKEAATEDPSANVPNDDEEPEGEEQNDDPSANVPTDDDEGNDQQIGLSINAGATGNDAGGDAGGGTDFSANVPSDDDTGGGDAPADNPPQPAEPAPPQETGGEQPGVGGGLDINANAADNAATANTDDFSANVPSDDDAAGGADDQNAQQPPDAGGDPNAAAAGANPNDPNAQAEGGDEQQDPNADPNAEGGAEGEGEEGEGDDGNGDINDMDSANSFSDASDNGEDTKSLTDNDKKNNIIILRNAYVNLYSEVVSFIGKMQNTRKDSILAVATYSKVKENMEYLRRFLMDYICIYYDTNEYEINLFNFEYILQHIRVHVKMIEKMKEGKEKLGLITSLKEWKKKETRKSKK